MTLAWSLLAMTVSAAALLMLGVGDPKRRRVVRAPGHQTRGQRQLLVGLALLPGFVLTGLGMFAALMIWLGGATVAGWAVAAGLSRAQ